MDQLGERLKHIVNDFKEYVETRLELLILKIGDKITIRIGHSVEKLLGFSLLGIGLLFALVALAIFLGEILNQPSLGYIIVAVPFLIIGVIFAFGKPRGIAKGIQIQIMGDIIEALEEEVEDISPQKKKELKENNVRK